MTPRSWFGLVLASVLAAGCSDCGGGLQPPEDAGFDAGMDPNTVCADLAARQCDYFIRCHADPVAAPSGVRIADNDAGFFDVVPETERARCVEAISKDRDCLAYQESVRLGRATYVDAEYQQCVDTAYPTDVCDRDFFAAFKECRGLPFLAPQVAQAGACSFDEECLGGGYCNATALETCGTCQPPSSVTGTACTRDAECARATYYCTGGDGTAGTCQPYTAANTTCAATDFQQEECGPTRVCANTSLLAFRCTTPRELGDPCELNKFQCRRSGRGVFELLCAPVVPLGGGTPVNRCTPTQAALNGACENGEGFGGFNGPVCPESQFCLNNVCTNKRAAGLDCATDDECAFGLRCLTPAGGGPSTCQPFLDVGQPCSVDEECKALLYCSGTCQPRLALNTEACAAGVTCANGYCDGASTTCVLLKADAEPCDAAAQCQSNVCSVSCQDACWD